MYEVAAGTEQWPEVNMTTDHYHFIFERFDELEQLLSIKEEAGNELRNVTMDNLRLIIEQRAGSLIDAIYDLPTPGAGGAATNLLRKLVTLLKRMKDWPTIATRLERTVAIILNRMW